MELIEAKITAIFALGFGSLISGLLPVLFTRFTIRAPKLFLSSLLCFGAGVLLSTSLVHLLPEIRRDLGEDYQEFAEVILCGGFFILYIIDEIAHLIYKQHNHSHNEATERTPLINPEGNSGENGEQSRLCHIGHDEPCESNYTGTVSLLLALTIHAVLEGLAVGLENSTEQVLMMLAAVASHKLVVGFCLGTVLSTSRHITSCRYFISIMLFSFGTSLGIGIGAKISNLPDIKSNLSMPILQGLAGGTLLFVTVIEVLPRERALWHKKSIKFSGILQLFTTMLGFSIMTLLIFYFPV